MQTKKEQLRVLVMRLGAMGDILHALPAITALRAAHPGWFLGWAVEPQWRGLLAAEGCDARGPGMPLVDRIHIVPAKQWGRAPLRVATLRQIGQVRSELKHERYDVCLDLQGAVRSALIGRSAGAARMIGEAKPREAAAKFLFGEKIPTCGVHVIEQAVEVTNAIAGEQLPLMPPLLPADDRAEAMAAELPQPFVLINPGAGWGAKRWPVERYAAVAKSLCEAGYGVVVNAGPGERLLAEELRDLSGGNAIVAQPTLVELTAIMRRASLAIAGDTGPLHLASALGKPVVGIFGPTDPARNGPFGGQFRVLRHPESKRDHTRHAEPEAGLLTIEPQAVLHAAMELLEGTK